MELAHQNILNKIVHLLHTGFDVPSLESKSVCLATEDYEVISSKLEDWGLDVTCTPHPSLEQGTVMVLAEDDFL